MSNFASLATLFACVLGTFSFCSSALADMVTLTEAFDVDPIDRLQWVGDSTGTWRASGGNSGGYLEYRGDTRDFSDSYFPQISVTMLENGSISTSADFYVEHDEYGTWSSGFGLSLYDFDIGSAVWSALVYYDHDTAADGFPAGWNTDPVAILSRGNANMPLHTYPAGTAVQGRWINMEATVTHLGLNSYNVLATADGFSVSQNFLGGLNLVGHQLSPLIYALPSHHVRFDNVSITGTQIVPELSSGLLTSFGVLAACSFHAVRFVRRARV